MQNLIVSVTFKTPDGATVTETAVKKQHKISKR